MLAENSGEVSHEKPERGEDGPRIDHGMDPEVNMAAAGQEEFKRSAAAAAGGRVHVEIVQETMETQGVRNPIF